VINVSDSSIWNHLLGIDEFKRICYVLNSVNVAIRTYSGFDMLRTLFVLEHDREDFVREVGHATLVGLASWL
jgi:hypothetical protein